LEKLTKALDDAHAARARLGDGGESNIIGPDDIDKLRDPAKRLGPISTGGCWAGGVGLLERDQAAGEL
jgi:hypothetical protein